MNNLKQIALTGTNDMKGLNAPCSSYTKTIEITDSNFNPLQNVHLTWGTNSGAITNASGIATVSVPNCNTLVTISHVGKRTHQAAYKDLGSLITLQDLETNLNPVVVGGSGSSTQVNKRTKPLLMGFGILAALALLFTKKDDKKKGLNVPATKTKPKTKSKSKPKKKAKKKSLRSPETTPVPTAPIDDIVTIQI